jgi:hypothetical protein
MKKQLGKMENRLVEIGEDVREIKADVKFLVGKTIEECLEHRCEIVENKRVFNKLWIPLKAVEYQGAQTTEVANTDDDAPQEHDLNQTVNEFLRSNDKSLLLLVGESGSGKSTFLSHFERDMLRSWKKSKGSLTPLFADLFWNEVQVIQNSLEELDLGLVITDIIKSMTEQNYKEILFFPSETIGVVKQLDSVVATKVCIEKLVPMSKEKNILIPIYCSLPTISRPLMNLIPES